MTQALSTSISQMLQLIPFEFMEPSPGEELGLYRLPLTHGCAEFVLLLADRYYPPHRHLEADAELHILRGTGEALLNGREQRYEVGTVLHVPRGTWHGFRTLTETVFLSLQSKPILERSTGVIDIEYQPEGLG